MASVKISLPDKEAKLGCGFDSSCRVVSKVQPEGLADQHQIAPGFILISINGADCDAMADISEIKEKLKERPVTLELAPPFEEEPEEPEGNHGNESVQKDHEEGIITLTATEGGLGFGVSPFPPAEKLFVKKVDAGSWAAQHGLKEGFQLLKVQGKDAGSLSTEDFRSAMKSQRPLELTFRAVEVESPKETTQAQAQEVQESPPAETPVAAPAEAKVEESLPPESKDSKVAKVQKSAQEADSYERAKQAKQAESAALAKSAMEAKERSLKDVKESKDSGGPKEKENVKEVEGPKENVSNSIKEEELAKLKKQLAQSAEELQRAQAELSQALKKSETSQAELTKLKEELAAKNRDLQERQLSANEETQKEIERLRDDVKAKEEELQKTKEEVKTAKANKERRKSQNKTMEDKLKQDQQDVTNAPIVGAEDDFAKRVRESAEVRDLKRQVELEIQTLRTELEELKAQVGSMRGSFSEVPGFDFKTPAEVTTDETTATQANLFKAAQPLLRPNTEKRSQAVQAVEVALQKGASPNSWQGPGSPLQAAVQARAPDLVKCLLKAHADPGEIDAHGVSLLHLATFHGEAEVSKLLLEANANPNVTDRYAQTPIFFAPTRQMCMTLHTFNADVNATNSKGQSPLHLAAKAGLGDVLHWLTAKASPEVLAAKDASGQRAADYAKAIGLRMGKLEGRAPKSPRSPASPTSPSARTPCGVTGPSETKSGTTKAPLRLAEPSMSRA